MVFSEILIKIPYCIAWNLFARTRKRKVVAFYCHEVLDYEIFRYVHKLLPEILIISKNKEIAKIIYERYEIKSRIYPVFPDVILMARHSLHLFPCKKIIKIGMRHGAYHFKEFISATKYNRFDLFFFTSHREVEKARSIGINNACWGGFPKCDRLFDSELIREAAKFKEQNCNSGKKTLLFSATWDGSGLSSIDLWCDKLSEIAEDYNIFVTLHPWVTKSKVEKIKSLKNVYFIDNQDDLYKYILISDAFIADTSSIIAEFMLTGKPIFTFRLPQSGRLTKEIYDMLEKNTIRVNSFQELTAEISKLDSNNRKIFDYSECLKIFFSDEIGCHGQLMAKKIRDFLKQKGVEI